MLDQVVIVGCLTADVVIEGQDRNKGTFVLAVSRPFKNADGVYETDFIPILCFGNVATNTAEYCKKGDIIGIKGRLQSNKNKIEVVAERITFLSSKKQDEE